MSETTQGKRHDFHDDEIGSLEPGDYGKNLDSGGWFMRPPQLADFHIGVGGLGSHTITEHEDGTITVAPSILCTGHHGVQWHGYLERGVWRKV